MSDGYETLNEAVYRAALASREASKNKKEAISLIYEDGGRFHFTPPSSLVNRSDKVKAKVSIPTGSLRFVVHNHPEYRNNERFSEDDIANSERLGVPSAIIFGASDPTIRIFTPGATRIDKTERDLTRGRRSSLGEEFLTEPFKGMMK